MKKTIIPIALIAVCAATALATVCAQNSRPRPGSEPYWKTEVSPVTTQAIALSPGQYWTQSLQVRNDWRNARLTGRFRAQGGGRNDIEAFITDEDGLENFQNGNQYNVWYRSGRVTTATINASIPTGQTYFVFSNKFSIVAHKSITFRLWVEYERLITP